MNYKHFFSYWFPVMVWIGFTFWMSTGTFASSHTSLIIEPLVRFFLRHASDDTIHFLHHIIRKLAHVTEYFVLGLLLFRAIRSELHEMRMRRFVFYGLLALALSAGLDEYHQTFNPTRTASAADVGIDLFGGFLGLCTMVLWNRFKQIGPIQGRK